MTKSTVRLYKLNCLQYFDQGADLEEAVVDSNGIIVQKIGYDKDMRPLYTMQVTDGIRPVSMLGYIVPPDTVPAYSLDDKRVEQPECTRCISTMGLGDEGGEGNMEGCGSCGAGCGCGAEKCW